MFSTCSFLQSIKNTYDILEILFHLLKYVLIYLIEICFTSKVLTFERTVLHLLVPLSKMC